MYEFRLRLTQRRFGVIRANHRGNIGADAAIAEEIAFRVKKWLAA
jgi:hypothetical protein